MKTENKSIKINLNSNIYNKHFYKNNNKKLQKKY